MYKKVLLSVAFSLAAVACRSKENVVKDVDTKLESSHGSTSTGELGTNKDGQAVIQSKTSAAAELSIQEHVNEKLLADLEGERHMLKLCRRDLADTRLGGNGEIAAIPEVDSLRTPDSATEEFGKDEKGRLVVVRRTMYNDKLKAEREFEASIRQVSKVVKKHRRECDDKMAAARVKQGLPANRYVAKGHFVNGQWIETRKAENSLDDAFDILQKEGERD